MISQFLGVDNTKIANPVGTIRVLPIPYDATTCYNPGTRFGPSAILKASIQLEEFNEDIAWDATQNLHFFVEDEIQLNVAGPQEMNDQIEKITLELLEHEDFILALGGEHSISFPLISAHNRKYEGLHVIQIDAHADLRDSWNGSSFSHACVMRRVAELGVRITQIGIRNVSQEGYEYLSSTSSKIHTWDADTIRREGNLERLLAYLRKEIASPIYLSIDVDGLDPSVIPATGTPEPGGLMWGEVMAIVKTICLNHTVVGADVVELSPTSTLFYADYTTAKLCYKIVSYAYYNKWKLKNKTHHSNEF